MRTGAGAYEGLSAILIVVPGGGQFGVEGVVFAGEMPFASKLPAE